MAERLPNTSYATQYPHNQCFVTKCGHEIHFDNTPGKERIRITHAKGTYTEWSADGNRTDFTVGHHQDYRKGGWTMTIDENGDVKIAGHSRINISGGEHKTTKGDSDSVTGGHSSIVVGGNAKIAVAGDAYMGVKGDMNMNVGGSVSMKVAGDMTMETQGTHTIKAAKIDMNP
jgi:hypothetical protein